MLSHLAHYNPLLTTTAVRLQMVKDAIGSIEQLDGALKRHEVQKAVALAQQAQDSIGAVVDTLVASK